jgi:hypothetical protein
LLAAADDHPVLGLFDDMQRNFVVFARHPLLVLRLLAAVDLRIAERVRQEQVVDFAISVIILEILAEIALRMLDGAELVLQVQRRNDVGRQNVGAAAELAPAQLVPLFAVAALLLEILGRAGKEPADTDPLPRVGVEAGHLIAVFGAVSRASSAIMSRNAGSFVTSATRLPSIQTSRSSRRLSR